MEEPNPTEVIFKFFGSRDTETFEMEEMQFAFGPDHYLLARKEGHNSLIPKSSVERVEIGKDVFMHHVLHWRDQVETQTGEPVPRIKPTFDGSS